MERDESKDDFSLVENLIDQEKAEALGVFRRSDLMRFGEADVRAESEPERRVSARRRKQFAAAAVSVLLFFGGWAIWNKQRLPPENFLSESVKAIIPGENLHRILDRRAADPLPLPPEARNRHAVEWKIRLALSDSSGEAAQGSDLIRLTSEAMNPFLMEKEKMLDEYFKKQMGMEIIQDAVESLQKEGRYDQFIKMIIKRLQEV